MFRELRVRLVARLDAGENPIVVTKGEFQECLEGLDAHNAILGLERTAAGVRISFRGVEVINQ